MRLRIGIGVALIALLGVSSSAQAAGSADVAALQVALRSIGLYAGTIDGVAGLGTRAAVRGFQARHGLVADGIAGSRTRTALGRRWRPLWARSAIGRGRSAWDVAALQFRLAWHGFPSGTLDGGFGSHTEAAVRRFQSWAGLEPAA